LQQKLEKMGTDCIWCCRRIHVRVQICVGVGVEVRVGTSVVGHVVDVEGADVQEEVLFGEGVVGRRDAVSSRAEALTRTGSQEAGFWRPTVTSSGARRKRGWRRCSGGAKLWR
jgi:hypothetical protein